jgi:uncharacterized protein (TIGR03083 family)
VAAEIPGIGPIETAHLFGELDARLLELLGSLTIDEWQRPTIVRGWCVKDVAAHLLDTALRRLSLARDGCMPARARVESDGDLVRLVNDLNARGVATYGALSPAVLFSLTNVAAGQLAEYFASLDPLAPATFPVSWAGETASANWFDIARELTERWHHQQQIRLAVDRPGIMTRRLLHPVLETFMRGLPYRWRHLEAERAAVARVTIQGDCGGTWHLERQPRGWAFVAPPAAAAIVSEVGVPEAIAWRVFTKGISREEALAHTTIEGDARVGQAVLDLVAIVG